ncbi:MAG: Crp/Fnr family transcriptional regulator [Chloroflexaceae bacterium]|nr:Crp/Fnr family transcriptional regulator [Chloroflexaceae bacterium]NJO06935.1 Crp/Fnr family transcriptional regulator [Chloroflexaceae bacterium]
MVSIPDEQTHQPLLKELLEQHATRQSFQRRSLIYTPEQAANTLYWLEEGQISLQLLSSTGRVLTLQIIEAGALFGHSALTLDETYDTFAEVTRPAKVLALSRDVIEAVLHEQPALGVALLHEMAQYRLSVSRRLEEVAFKSVPARLASLLLEMAGAVAEVVDEQQLRVPRHTHQQLAEMINAYRETVTKVMNQFRAEKLLTIDRSFITVLNPSGLMAVAQGC